MPTSIVEEGFHGDRDVGKAQTHCEVAQEKDFWNKIFFIICQPFQNIIHEVEGTPKPCSYAIMGKRRLVSKI